MRSCAALALLVAVAFPASAEDLLQVYRDSQRYDATYSAARNNLAAGRERLPQGRALLLPTLNLTANATHSRLDVASRDTTLSPSFLRNPDSSGYTLTLTQPIFRAQNYLQYEQGGFQVRQAEATFGQAAQDLIVRVAQAYFDVLGQYDTLILVRAQKAATSEQLAQAKRNFEVGTATITDTHEAQARYDLIAAQEIAALNDLQARRRQLQLIAGKEYTELKQLRADVKLAPPNPDNVDTWAELAEKQSYSVLIQEAAAEVASLEAKRATAGHLPTLDFVATYGQLGESSTSVSPIGRDSNNSTVGVQLALPIFQGGSVSSREREAAALYLRSKDDLENAKRTAVLTTRQLYLSTINGITQVAALEQARVSSQSALDSNKLGYEVGIRINIDVLNAQQQLYSTERDLALARYNTILNSLRLKAAAGALREEDLEEVNRVLTVTAGRPPDAGR
jgi:outer membrane protein